MPVRSLSSRIHRLPTTPVIVVLGLVLFSAVAYGRGTAKIVCAVITGAVVPNAKVDVTNTGDGFNRNTISNSAGRKGLLLINKRQHA